MPYSQKLLLFNGLEGSFRTVKLRPRQVSCAVCGDSPSVTKLVDYVQFCGSAADDKVRERTHTVQATALFSPLALQERTLDILEESDRTSCRVSGDGPFGCVKETYSLTRNTSLCLMLALPTYCWTYESLSSSRFAD